MRFSFPYFGLTRQWLQAKFRVLSCALHLVVAFQLFLEAYAWFIKRVIVGTLLWAMRKLMCALHWPEQPFPCFCKRRGRLRGGM